MIPKLKIVEEEIKEEIKVLAPDCDRIMMEAKTIEIFGEEAVDFTDHGLIIHFPEIVIKNRDGLEHTIYDLYIRLYWSFNENGSLNSFNNYIKGFRGTITYEEAYSNYLHSHLVSMSEFTSTNEDGDRDESEDASCFVENSNFCLGGSSDITNILSTLNMEFNLDQYMILLLSLDDFVRWESLDGGPHILIENIVHFGDSFTEITDIERTGSSIIPNVISQLYTVLKEDKFKELELYPDSIQTLLADKPSFREIFEASIPLSIKNNYDETTKYKGKYYFSKTGTGDIINEVHNKNIESGYPRFKKESVYIKIIDPPEIDEVTKEIQEKGVKVIPPYVSNSFLETVEKDLHNYLNNNDKWKLKK